MKKAIQLSLVAILIFAFVNGYATAQTVEEGLYYSPLMVKNGTFTWNVNQSESFYEEALEEPGVNFTVTLKDDLYPGPLFEEDLEKVYASVKVDGNKYTGEGFPLFWHLYEIDVINDTYYTNTTIREEFEAETTLFNVSDGASAEMFVVNFTIVDEENGLQLDVIMDINGTSGITQTYYEFFQEFNPDNLTEIISNSTIELVYIGYTTESPYPALWTIAGVFTIGALVVIRKRKQKK